LWLARYYIKKAKSLKDLEPAYHWIDWVIAHAQPSGVLSEQINPLTGLQMSATPLIWSQSEYIKTILDLSKKEAELK
jgi:GH15 family glucan-1,4-alpha-glucosidase